MAVYSPFCEASLSPSPAFKATLKDPEFLAEAKRSKLTINYVSGEEIEKFVDEILVLSPETKESLQFLVIKKKKGKS